MPEVVVGRADEIPPGTVRVVPVGPYGVGIYNVDGHFHALLNYCVHEGAPVCSGKITGTSDSPGERRTIWIRHGEILRCPWHGWEFEIQSGRAIADPRQRLKSYPVRVVDGQVVLEFGGARKDSTPAVAEMS